MVRRDNVFVIQLQRADERLSQLREEVQRASEERHVAPDRLAAGKAADRLVHHCLEDRRRKVLLGGTLVDQGLDIRLGEYAAACCDGIERLVILRVLIQAGCIRLEQGRHLVDKRTCTSGTDSVHTLLYISAFKINDLGILTAQLDGDVCLRRVVLERSGYRDDLLDKWHAQVFGQGQAAAPGDDRRDLDGPQLVESPS